MAADWWRQQARAAAALQLRSGRLIQHSSSNHPDVAFAGPAHARALPAACALPQRVTEGRRYFDFEFTAKSRGYTRHALASVTVGNGGWSQAMCTQQAGHVCMRGKHVCAAVRQLRAGSRRPPTSAPALRNPRISTCTAQPMHLHCAAHWLGPQASSTRC